MVNIFILLDKYSYSIVKMSKIELINTFKSCLNILRDSEGITGEKALRNISLLLIIKLIEPHIGVDIDFDNYDFDFSYIQDIEYMNAHKTRLLSLTRFSNIVNSGETNMVGIFYSMWQEILSEHPKTSNIFIKDKSFDIKKEKTFKLLVDKLAKLDLSDSEYDVLGGAYEEVIQDIMTGKVLGQFFTQPQIKKLMVKLVDPQIYEDGTIDSCCDPAMGTGGFLISYLNHIIAKSKEYNVNLDWEYITNEGIYGKEIDQDTYQLATSNMLISSGHIFSGLENGDSIRKPITKKFDIVLANPPFGIKGLKYDSFFSDIKDKYLPIKSDNAVSLFLQAIIYMLNIEGKCAIVLPDGKDLFSKSNKSLVSIREYLMKSCDLKEVIYLPSGIFTYTSIKTCVFYFVKKIGCSKALQVKDKKYIFAKNHQTKAVKFYDYDPDTETKKLLIKVPIEDISSNSYSLNFNEYIKEEPKEYDEGTIVKKLGDICTFLPKSKRTAKHGQLTGTYPFFKSSMKLDSYVDEADYDKESLIIGTGGTANVKYSSKFSCSSDNFVLVVNECDTKYVYYYLLNNIELLQKGFSGVSIQHVTKDYIKNIDIPIPSLEKQKEIIDYCDAKYAINEQLKKDIEKNIDDVKAYICKIK